MGEDVNDDPTGRDRTGKEMYDLLLSSARGLGKSCQRGGIPLVPAVGAAFLSATREVLELAVLDPKQAAALLDHIRTLDPPNAPYDMVQSAREVAYDIPVSYSTEEELRESEAKARRDWGYQGGNVFGWD